MFRRLTNERDNIYIYVYNKRRENKTSIQFKESICNGENKPTGYLLLHVSYEDLKRFVQIND